MLSPGLPSHAQSQASFRGLQARPDHTELFLISVTHPETLSSKDAREINGRPCPLGLQLSLWHGDLASEVPRGFSFGNPVQGKTITWGPNFLVLSYLFTGRLKG